MSAPGGLLRTHHVLIQPDISNANHRKGGITCEFPLPLLRWVPMTAKNDLAAVLANGDWARREFPFPHVVASDVFTSGFYEALALQLLGMLGGGPEKTKLPRTIPGQDVYGMPFPAHLSGPLAAFLSPAWRDLMCKHFDIAPTPYIYAGAHHHSVGSKSGFIHSDFGVAWYPRNSDGGIQLPDNRLCNYVTGAGELAGADKVQVVRGVVLLFYLLNDGWEPGDGGETGLYASDHMPVAEPSASVPPVNNSLVAFECSPTSFHTFISNRKRPRTSITVTVHRTLDDAERRFGREPVIRVTHGQ
jgi:hypothetical protein